MLFFTHMYVVIYIVKKILNLWIHVRSPVSSSPNIFRYYQLNHRLEERRQKENLAVGIHTKYKRSFRFCDNCLKVLDKLTAVTSHFWN